MGQPYTTSTCASSGSPSVRLRSSIGTSIGRSLFLCKWSSSTSFSQQSSPTLEQECSSACLGGNVKTAFDIMKFIVTVGWSIYPLGYFFGYLQSGVDDSTLNLVYNLADFVNKIAFCLAIWNCAKQDTAERA